jgi:hypothetical protein
LPSLHSSGDGGQRGELRPLRQARCGAGVQALLGLQARLLLRGCMPEHKLEAPQEEVRAAGVSAGRRCENQRGTDNRGLAGSSAVRGAHGRAGGRPARWCLLGDPRGLLPCAPGGMAPNWQQRLCALLRWIGGTADLTSRQVAALPGPRRGHVQPFRRPSLSRMYVCMYACMYVCMYLCM